MSKTNPSGRVSLPMVLVASVILGSVFGAAARHTMAGDIGTGAIVGTLMGLILRPSLSGVLAGLVGGAFGGCFDFLVLVQSIVRIVRRSSPF